MKILNHLTKIGVLCAVILVITSCQKELQIAEKPETVYQQQRLGGVVPDDPAKVSKVPLIMSSEALKSGSIVQSPLIDGTLSKGKPPAKTGDTAPPTVSITSPANGSTVSGTVSIAVSASDNVGVSAVSLYVNGVLLNTFNSSPYNFSWNSSAAAAGTYTLMATAKDANGNSTSIAITVAISTTITVLPPPPTSPSTGISLLMPPVGNQGSEFSCVAFAVGYAARSAEQYYRSNASSYSFATNIFSPEFLYNQTKIGTDCSSGSSMTTALDFIKINGISSFQTMPYNSTNGCSLLPTSLQQTEANTFKINGYSKIISTDQVAIKTMIDQKHPVIVIILTDNSFELAKTGFIWKTYSGSLGVPHGIVICGYDDSKNAYKVMNSWGTGWADGGFSWIDYDLFPTRATYYSYVIN